MEKYIKQYYQEGLYTADDVRTCVPVWITQEQANEIINAK